MRVAKDNGAEDNDNAHWEGAPDENPTPPPSSPLFEWPYPTESHGEEAHDQ